LMLTGSFRAVQQLCTATHRTTSDHGVLYSYLKMASARFSRALRTCSSVGWL
jgi:hypothetical protein